jgi:hypothetical protein
MKTGMILGLSISCMMASLASADESIDAATLGRFDAAIAYCRQISPGGESSYKALRASLIGELPGPAVEALMQTAEYREAYDAGSKSAADESRESAVKDCAKLVPARGPRKPRAHKHE